MHEAGTLKAPSDRTLNRLIVGMILVLAVGIPLIGALYVVDQYRSPGPSLTDRAILLAEEAVRRNPNQVSARLGLAVAYRDAKRYADAIAQFGEVLRVQPENRDALLGRGRVELETGALAPAQTDLQKLVTVIEADETAVDDPNLEAAYYFLGSALLKQGRTNDALVELTKALQMDATDADALYLYGTAKARTGDNQTAILALRKAALLVPTGWCEPYAALAQAYGALSNAEGVRYAEGMAAGCALQADQARAKLQPLITGMFAADAWAGLGLLAEQLGDQNEAYADYANAYRLDSANFGAVNGLQRLGGLHSPAPTSVPLPSTPTTTGGN